MSSSKMDQQLSVLYQQLQHATNTSQLDKLISSIDLELIHTEQEVSNYISRSSKQLESDLNTLELKRLNLSSTFNEHSNPLVNKISNANDLSYTLTKKIRLLDHEKDQINTAFKYVQSVTFLKNEILNCHLFLESKDWKELSKCIYHILSDLPSDLLEDDEFVSFVVPTSDLPDLPKNTVSKWVEELCSFFKTEFEKAALNKDVNKLTEYFLLFPLILKSDVGMTCYSKFVVNLVNEQAKNLLTNISKNSKSKPGFYSLTLLKIFEIISTIINQHSRLIVQNYDSKSMLQIITRIQKECDIQSGLIFDTFWDAKGLQNVLQRVARYDFPILVSMMLDSHQDEEEISRRRKEEISILEVNDLCFELASILKNWKMYCNFLKIKWDSYSGLSNSNEIPTPVLESSFIVKTKDKIVPTFEELSTFQLRKSIEKSFDMEELPDLSSYLLSDNSSSDAPITSIVDDVILVLNNVLSRTLETGDEIIIKNMITNSKRILEIDLLQLLMKKLSTSYPRANVSLVIPTAHNVKDSNEFSRDLSLSPRPGTPLNSNYGSLFMKGATSAITNAMNFNKDDDLRRLEHFIVYLNSIETLKNYLLKLIGNLNDKIVSDKLFMHYDDDEENTGNGNLYNNSVTRKLSNILNLLGQTLEKKCDSIVNDHLNQLYQQSFNSRVYKLVNDFFSNPEEYISSSSNSNEELLKFINQFRILYQPYQKTLLPSLFLKLMSVLTGRLSLYLERRIMSFKFTDVGALSLEKNLSFIIGDVSKIDYKLREKFLRVTQIVMVLSLDDDEEDQLFNDDEDDDKLGINWVLTPSERKKVRSLRIDLGKLN